MAAKPAVLVTRPSGQAAQLAASVAAAGYPVHRLPLLELQALETLAPEQRTLVLDLDHYQHVIFISGNAVRFGMHWIESFWPQLPVGLNWYAIGDATAAGLREYGIEAIAPSSPMTSEALLAVPQLQSVSGQRVLIIKGEGGRGTLARVLRQRGAQVAELACYHRCCPAIEAGEVAAKLSAWQVGMAMISSGEGLANLLALLSPAETTKFRYITLLVPSERVAADARKAGFEKVLTARNASDSAMLQALHQGNPARETD